MSKSAKTYTNQELSIATNKLCKKLNSMTHSKLGEKILLLEFKLSCIQKLRIPPKEGSLSLESRVDLMITQYEVLLARYRKGCWLGKILTLLKRFRR